MSDEMAFHAIMQDERALERDRALVAFLRVQIAERVPAAEDAERGLLAAVERVLGEFSANFEHAARCRQDEPLAQHTGALGWSLRCTAFAAFSEHPDFRMDFRP
ncbi:hypothetical protein [Streptomyces sp. MT206]|uniref:hypothetical protein n=1 Tax=Streptomyces sp. MT206 TaxID=3031407 RepID=UPI002FC66542